MVTDGLFGTDRAVVMLGELHPVSNVGYLLSLSLVAAVTVLWVRLQTVVLRLRAAQANSRWASNVRDLIALAGASGLTVAFHFCGLPWAAAVLFAGATAVIIELLRRGERPKQAVILVAALAFVSVVSLWPARSLEGANRLAKAMMADRTTSSN